MYDEVPPAATPRAETVHLGYDSNFSHMDYASSDAEALDLALALEISLLNEVPGSDSEYHDNSSNAEEVDDADEVSSQALTELSQSFTSVSALTQSDFERLEYDDDWIDLGQET